MNQHVDVVVVGAGIVGAACAEAIAARGRSVAVLDRTGPGTATTAAGMGHLVVMDGSPAQLRLTALSRRLWDERTHELPHDVEYERCGTLWVAEDDEEMAEATAKRELYEAQGIEARVIDSNELARREPKLRPGLAGALLVPGDAVVYQPNAARWLLERAKQHGSCTLHRAEVRKAGRGHVECSNGDTFEAEHVVVAASAASTPLLRTRGLDNVIVRRKGHLAVTARAPGLCRHQLVELGYIKRAHGHARESVAFNLQPRSTGQVLIGSSRQYGARDGRVEPGIIGRMFRRVLDFMPALARVPIVRTWTGFRPATADGLPLIGALPNDEQTFVAAGHEGLGITTSLGTAALLDALMHGTTPPIEPRSFSPERAVEATGGD